MSRRFALISVAVAMVVATACLEDCDDKNDPSGPTGSIGVGCSASPESGAAPLAVNFKASASGVAKDAVTYRWSFGDGSTASTDSLVKTFNSGGTFGVTVTAIASDGRQGTCQKTIKVDSALRIDACSADPGSGKAPLGVQFHSQVVGNGQNPITYAWDFGDGAGSSDPNPAHTYNTIGNYTARMTATSQGSTAQCTVPIGAFDSLDVTCSALPRSGDAPLSVSFDADAPGQSGCSYTWDFDGVWTANQKAVTHRYDTGGTYYPTVTATCGGRRGSCRQRIDVIAPQPTPVPTATPTATPTPTPTLTPTPDCSGTFTFVGTGTPLTMPWISVTYIAPVTLTGLPTGCRVRTATYTLSFSSDVDMSTALPRNPYFHIVNLSAGAASVTLMTTRGTSPNIPASFSGLTVGTTCGSLRFAAGESSFTTALPPYDGLFAPAGDAMPGLTADFLNGDEFALAPFGPGTGNLTLNCWAMALTFEPIP